MSSISYNFFFIFDFIFFIILVQVHVNWNVAQCTWCTWTVQITINPQTFVWTRCCELTTHRILKRRKTKMLKRKKWEKDRGNNWWKRESSTINWYLFERTLGAFLFQFHLWLSFVWNAIFLRCFFFSFIVCKQPHHWLWWFNSVRCIWSGIHTVHTLYRWDGIVVAVSEWWFPMSSGWLRYSVKWEKKKLRTKMESLKTET